jgi:hypothetical protein
MSVTRATIESGSGAPGAASWLLPLTTTTSAAGPGVAVASKIAGRAPGIWAVTRWVLARGPSVHLTFAKPWASETGPAFETMPLPSTTLKKMVTPSFGLPKASVTLTVRSVGSVVCTTPV